MILLGSVPDAVFEWHYCELKDRYCGILLSLYLFLVGPNIGERSFQYGLLPCC